MWEKKDSNPQQRRKLFLASSPKKRAEDLIYGVKSVKKQDPFSFQAYIKNMTTLQTKELTLQM